MFRNKVCQFFYAGIHPRWTFWFAQRWSLKSRQKGMSHRTAHLVPSAGYLIEFANEYLLTHPDIRFFIFGHCHAMIDKALTPDTRLLVAGEWMTHFSYIQWDGNQLALKEFDF
jgi:UDP-2,3-diacylglucosamine hydrolase